MSSYILKISCCMQSDDWFHEQPTEDMLEGHVSVVLQFRCLYLIIERSFARKEPTAVISARSRWRARQK